MKWNKDNVLNCVNHIWFVEHSLSRNRQWFCNVFQCTADLQIWTPPFSLQAAFRWKGRTQSLRYVAYMIASLSLDIIVVCVYEQPVLFCVSQPYWTAAGASLALSCYGTKQLCPVMQKRKGESKTFVPFVLQKYHNCIIFISISQWFLRPTQDLAMLQRRQEVIHFFTSPKNSDILSTLQSSLRNIRNIPVQIAFFSSHLLPFTLLPLEWLPEYLYHTISIMSVKVCICVLQTLLRRMSLSHTKVTDWQSLYKVGTTG